MQKLFVGLLILLATSCTKNNYARVTLIPWRVTGVDGPATGGLNQRIALTVYWPYSSGSCDFLDKFEESRQGNIVYIKALGHTNRGICSHNAGTKTKIYNFQSSAAGIFELKFISNDTSVISHSITIN